MPNGCKRALDRVCGPQVPPVLGGEVIESEQRVAIFGEALNYLFVFAAVLTALQTFRNSSSSLATLAPIRRVLVAR